MTLHLSEKGCGAACTPPHNGGAQVSLRYVSWRPFIRSVSRGCSWFLFSITPLQEHPMLTQNRDSGHAIFITLAAHNLDQCGCRINSSARGACEREIIGLYARMACNAGIRVEVPLCFHSARRHYACPFPLPCLPCLLP